MSNFSPIKSALISLLVLLAILPFGISSISSTYFLGIFVLHLALLIFASSSAFLAIYSFAQNISYKLQIFSFFSFILLLLACLPNIILPVTARDALIHHLAIPKLWIEHGAIYSTPWHEWSFYPMLIQLAFSSLLQIGPEQICSLYIFLFTPLLALVTSKLTYVLTEREEAPTVAAALIILIPVILKLSGIPLVDLPLVFLCGAGTYYLFKLQFDINKIINLVFAGLAWGLALSCKLNAIPAFGLSIVIFGAAAISLHKNISMVFRKYAIIIMIAFFCYLPWLIKNTIWAGNPFYPYFSSIFGQSNFKFDAGLSGLNSLQQRIMLYGESIFDVILLPIRIFVEGQDDNPRLFDGVLSPLLLLGICLGLYKSRDLKFRQLILFSIAYIIFSLISTGARVRYMAPVLVILVALSATALAKLIDKGKVAKSIVTILLISQLIASTLYVKSTSNILEAYAYLSGQLSKSSYLKSKIPEYDLIEYCNSNLPANSKISLIYTGNQFFLYEREIYSSGHTSADQFLYWIKQSSTVSQLSEKISTFGLTHFIIHDDRLSSVLETGLNDQQKLLLNEFVATHLIRLYSSKGFSLYQIK